MAVGQRCPLGSPFYLETSNLKKQNKGHQHIVLEIVSIYCFLSPSLSVFFWTPGNTHLAQPVRNAELSLPQTSVLQLVGLIFSVPGELRNLLGLVQIWILMGLVFPALFIMLILLNSFGSGGEQSKLGCDVWKQIEYMEICLVFHTGQWAGKVFLGGNLHKELFIPFLSNVCDHLGIADSFHNGRETHPVRLEKRSFSQVDVFWALWLGLLSRRSFFHHSCV